MSSLSSLLQELVLASGPPWEQESARASALALALALEVVLGAESEVVLEKASARASAKA